MPRTAWGILFVVLLLVLAPERARADRVDDLIDELRGSSDYKVRLSAALALSKLGDQRAVPALIRALRDSDKTVRGVAAASLAKLVDGNTPESVRKQAVAALKRTSQKDSNAFVRKQAKKAYDILRKVKGNAGGAVSGSIYVNIGPMSAKSNSGEKMKNLMRKSTRKIFKRKASTMMLDWPGGKKPTKRQIRSKKVSAFYVDGTLKELSESRRGSTTIVACKVSMLIATYPDKSMFGFLNGGAKVQASSSERDIGFAKEDCVAAVVEDLVGKKIIPTIQARAR